MSLTGTLFVIEVQINKKFKFKLKVVLRRKYTFSNLSRYQNYITQIVVDPWEMTTVKLCAPGMWL